MHSSKGKPNIEVPRDKAQHNWQELELSTHSKILILII